MGRRGADQLRRGLRHLGRRLRARGGVDPRGAGRAPSVRRRPGSVVPPVLGLAAGRPGLASSAEDAERWLDLQGPVTPALADAAAECDADAMVFYPYLYWPTVRIIERVPVPTILHPAAHDEPALHLPVFPGCSRRPTPSSSRPKPSATWWNAMFPVASHHQLLLGLGVDDPDPCRLTRDVRSPERAGTSLSGLPGPGRRAQGDHHAGRLFRRATRNDIRAPSAWCWPDRWSTLPPPIPTSTCSVRCPRRTSGHCWRGRWPWCRRRRGRRSPWSVAEAWSARTPVVVNAGCAATVEHCRRSGGGLRFDGFGEFEVVVDRLAADAGLGPPTSGDGGGPMSTPVSVGRWSSSATPASSSRWSPGRPTDGQR